MEDINPDQSCHPKSGEKYNEFVKRRGEKCFRKWVWWLLPWMIKRRTNSVIINRNFVWLTRQQIKLVKETKIDKKTFSFHLKQCTYTWILRLTKEITKIDIFLLVIQGSVYWRLYNLSHWRISQRRFSIGKSVSHSLYICQ